jgi:hypothetical protein
MTSCARQAKPGGPPPRNGNSEPPNEPKRFCGPGTAAACAPNAPPGIPVAAEPECEARSPWREGADLIADQDDFSADDWLAAAVATWRDKCAGSGYVCPGCGSMDCDHPDVAEIFRTLRRAC